ncbi:MAG: glycerate kinase, partial [Bacteroidota bacterium]
LLGERGATYTYATQKGADSADLSVLEKNMTHLADRLGEQLGVDVRGFPGAGAAGGLGAGIVAFLNGTLRPGIELLMEAVNFDQLLEGADLVITGEGKIDEQTPHGKVVSGVAKKARAAEASVVACGGVCTLKDPVGTLPEIDRILTLMELPGMTETRAMTETAALLEELIVNALTGDAPGRILPIFPRPE